VLCLPTNPPAAHPARGPPEPQDLFDGI